MDKKVKIFICFMVSQWGLAESMGATETKVMGVPLK